MLDPTANERLTTFVGGYAGSLVVLSHSTLAGPPITRVARVEMLTGPVQERPPTATWTLCGIATNDRYTTRPEKDALLRQQAHIGRTEATQAALILLKKRDDWWALTQDERRTILEEDSHHIAIGLRYLPAVARKLLHCRDLGGGAPFDFLGFLDFAPVHISAFEDMLGELRTTKEWSFMEREVDVRLMYDRPV